VVSPVDPMQQTSTTGIIRQAARETGTDFNFLVRTAARESNFDANAQASTSSAAGMYQFIEQTWLSMVDRHGAQHGYGEQASAISRDTNGRYQIADAERRQEVLDLRFDAEASARMAGELAGENANIIENRIGRRPSSGELYAAHFLGADGAAGLITAAETSPSMRADHLFPQAAQANRPIFYEGGQPRSTREVLALLSGEHSSARSVPTGSPQTEVSRSASSSFAPYTGAIRPGSMRVGDGELSPAIVEILASLEAPEKKRVRET
jgi:hypothetical protein